MLNVTIPATEAEAADFDFSGWIVLEESPVTVTSVYIVERIDVEDLTEPEVCSTCDNVPVYELLKPGAGFAELLYCQDCLQTDVLYNPHDVWYAPIRK